MTHADGTPPPSDPSRYLKHCWACGSFLKVNQKFCTECNHWQTWRRHLTFSTTILSLLVALIAVTPAFLDAVLAFHDPLKVDISIANVGSNKDPAATIQVVNQGSSEIVTTGELSCLFHLYFKVRGEEHQVATLGLRGFITFSEPEHRVIRTYSDYPLPAKFRTFDVDTTFGGHSEMDILRFFQMHHDETDMFASHPGLGEEDTCELKLSHDGEIKTKQFIVEEPFLITQVLLNDMIERQEITGEEAAYILDLWQKLPILSDPD